MTTAQPADNLKPDPPTVEEIENARDRLGDMVRETPVWPWRGDALDRLMGERTEVLLKLELFQYAGSFKPRGALTNMLSLSSDELARGVTTVSAGNHAMATGYAAKVLGSTAKVVMPKTANPARVEACKRFGAEVILVDDVHRAFELAGEIEQKEGRTFVHPFEGRLTALGTATLGLEFSRQAPELDAVIIPIGGGGLCAGVSSAFKRLRPECMVFGVEPEGADTMHKSFASGQPESIDKVRTIADSLGAPYCKPYTLGLCRRCVDELVLIDDDMMCRSMALIFRELKLAVEPAGAASTAALLGPLRDRLAGKRVGLIVCGTNIDLHNFAKYTKRGFELLDAS